MKKSGNYVPMSAEERLKYEIAEELGLLERVSQVGWGGLSTVETGRIGGLVRARKKDAAHSLSAGEGPSSAAAGGGHHFQEL